MRSFTRDLVQPIDSSKDESMLLLPHEILHMRSFTRGLALCMRFDCDPTTHSSCRPSVGTWHASRLRSHHSQPHEALRWQFACVSTAIPPFTTPASPAGLPLALCMRLSTAIPPFTAPADPPLALCMRFECDPTIHSPRGRRGARVAIHRPFTVHSPPVHPHRTRGGPVEDIQAHFASKSTWYSKSSSKDESNRLQSSYATYSS